MIVTRFKDTYRMLARFAEITSNKVIHVTLPAACFSCLADQCVVAL